MLFWLIDLSAGGAVMIVAAVVITADDFCSIHPPSFSMSGQQKSPLSIYMISATLNGLPY